jgi:hypothetical protein
MSRLQSEWRRLYLPHALSFTAEEGGADASTRLIDAKGDVRALVMGLARPADWAAVASVWRSVQSDLGLPAPAIAVSGVDAYQLWFSLEEALSVQDAHAFLEALRQRYLPDIAVARVDLLPCLNAQADAALPGQALHASVVPGQQVALDQWSAFLAPDLAPMFADTPWLDIPPSPEGQAELLSGLKCINRTDWQTAWARLQPDSDPVTSASATATAQAPAPTSASTSTGDDATSPCLDAKRFLLDVMNDGTVAMALRIEAAKALLPYTDSHR